MDDWTISLTVRRAGTELDMYGDPLGETEHVVHGALFEPGQSTNTPDRSDLTDDRPRLYFPEQPEADIRNGDTVVFSTFGEDYEYTVQGKPLRYPLGAEVILGD